MLGGLTGSEDKDLSGNPAWKVTGPMPAEGRMDDDEENTNLIYGGWGGGKEVEGSRSLVSRKLSVYQLLCHHNFVQPYC